MSLEERQLGRTVLPQPGGAATVEGQPWAAVTPQDAVDRLDALLVLVEECHGNVRNYPSHLSEDARYKPFVLSTRITHADFYALCHEHVAPAWFGTHTHISSDRLAHFYEVVIGRDHRLPYVDQPEGHATPVSWFRSTGNGLWRSTRPPAAVVPVFVQDVATASALYGRPRLPPLYVYRPRRSPSAFDDWSPRTSVGRGELSQLLLLVRQMGGDQGDALLSEAVRTHVKRIAKGHRTDSRGRPAVDTGIPVSLYHEE